jgi:hypothetical protein
VDIPRQTWIEIQKAETLLVHAGRSGFPEAAKRLSDDFPVEGADRVYLSRFFSGFDLSCITADAYCVRYPFSTPSAVEEVLDRLCGTGFLEPAGDAYAMTPRGMKVARLWLKNVGAMLSGLVGDEFRAPDAEALARFDRRIVEALGERSDAFSTPIFEHRAHGVQPTYDPPQLWHHWQLVWSMLACDEDAQEHVRKARGKDPLEWFFLRQLWFVTERPWRARLAGSSLDRIANRYAPVDEAACREAWERLVRLELVTGSYESPALTQRGFTAHDEDEQEVDRLFLSRWPAFSAAELAELTELTTRLNRHLEQLLEGDETA